MDDCKRISTVRNQNVYFKILLKVVKKEFIKS